MRHGKKINHLSRTASHRSALLANMASSLIANKRITTTVAKAKALRKYVEPLLTKSKDNSTHSRRVVFGYLQDKFAVQTLFDEIAGKIADRPGGYTRIIKMGNRLGDNADMALIELVDYNELLLKEDKPEVAKTRRSRRGGAKKDSGKVADAPVAADVEETVEAVAPGDVTEAEIVEDVVEVAADTEDVVEVVEDVVAEEPTAESEPEEDSSEEKDENKDEKS